MVKLVYEGKTFDCRDNETVLEALLRQGQNPPFSCRNGSCLVCLQRCTQGAVPEQAQRALRPTLQKAGYFLPCKCRPTTDMEIAPPRPADLYSRAVVHEKTQLAPDVFKILLESATSLYYHAGQFINIRRSDGLSRSYSLASLPAEDYYLEIHVKRRPQGALSTWLCDTLAPGDEVEYQGPNGSCYYVPGTQDENLLLIANGTGIAPLMGVIRDALHVGHRGKLWLLHGSGTAAGVYLHNTFIELAKKHANLTYTGCVSGKDVPQGFTAGRADDIAFEQINNLKGWRVFAAGLPEMVSRVEARALHQGVSPQAIHVDPHGLRTVDVSSAPAAAAFSPPTETNGDPEMWQALQQGKLMTKILTEFYTEVFQDPILSPYFQGFTQERLVTKVYSFMRDRFTGERLYFGARPRWAHNWMVISDEIFDHREKLMEKHLRKNGLPEHLIQRWRKYEESFRGDIVKDKPEKIVIDGYEIPVEGFGTQQLTIGTLCDGCQREINAGETVSYHLRLGSTYCQQCSGNRTQPSM